MPPPPKKKKILDEISGRATDGGNLFQHNNKHEAKPKNIVHMPRRTKETQIIQERERDEEEAKTPRGRRSRSITSGMRH